MDGMQILVSVLSGGLAGGCVSTFSNRLFYWRNLRTQFYPKLNNMFAAYVLRMEEPEGRYWTGTVGYVPSKENEKFVNHRSEFISDLISFNELKEARVLRQIIPGNMGTESGETGTPFKVDLMPEYQSLSDCMSVLHKKLKL